MADWNPAANELFLAALEIDDPERRRVYLGSACAGDANLQQAVEGLLQAHADAGSFLDTPGGAVTEAPASQGSTVVPDAPLLEKAGTIIDGRYKLLQSLGEGGMGAVWMAEQSEPVKRMVALKVIKAGMDSAQIISRFEAERQALALMDHPNIAKVLDAGAAQTGRPYFVMELVKGISITKYCDECRLSPRERLMLFIPVCQAVQHAHQKGIIHRDLKPSNVMIALYDGKPVPKVIDFGVAKAAGQKLTEGTLFTGFGAIVGTLEYMSPEQAELNQLDIDTRSDIYSLGVLLYEILTGSTPLDRKRLKEGAMLEILRLIREEEPLRPSARLSTSESLAIISEQRGMTPASLSKLMRGELDWIVMKALDKDRNRRYETANGLAQDIERYLRDEPVQAGPPSTRYQWQKFVKRNRATVLAASLILLALLLGVIGTTTGMVQARHAEQHAVVEEGKAKKMLQEIQLHDQILRDLLERTPRNEFTDANLKMGLKVEGPALVISAAPRININDAPYALWTRPIVRDKGEVDLHFYVFQNSDLLTRSNRHIAMTWRIPHDPKANHTFRVHGDIFYPDTAELKLLLPQMQRLVPGWGQKKKE